MKVEYKRKELKLFQFFKFKKICLFYKKLIYKKLLLSASETSDKFYCTSKN